MTRHNDHRDDGQPDAPVADDQRCRPHDNRLPCPICLAEKYQLYVWNN